MKKYGNNGVMEMWSNFNDDDSAVAVAFVYFVREVSWTFKQYDKQVMTVIVFFCNSSFITVKFISLSEV